MDRDWRFSGSIETYKARVGARGLAEYVAILERLASAPKSRGPLGVSIGVARRHWPSTRHPLP